MEEVNVPFTNNLAENIRMIKDQQKLSGCFRSHGECLYFLSYRSYISMCRENMVWLLRPLKMLFKPKCWILYLMITKTT